MPFLLAMTLLANSPALAAAACMPQPDIQEAARIYRQLNAQAGHFSGAPWQAALDAYGGTKYCSLEALRLPLLRKHKREIITLLGVPELHWLRGQAAPSGIAIPAHLATADEYLWYSWRAQRDGLLIAVQQNHAYASIWSLAGE